MFEKTLQFGRKRIVYVLRYSARKTLGIDVHPDLSVVVTAPHGSKDTTIELRVQKRAAWIVEQQRFFENYLPSLPPRNYISGESHRYLGRQYRLRVIEGNDEHVKLARGQINVTLPGRRLKDRVRPLVQRWFRHRAEVIFSQLFDEWAKKASRFEIETDSFQIRKMKTRWGSCTKQGQIILNSELIAAPKGCIEYVIAHEICHLKEHNHGKDFYHLLRKLMPDWERRRQQLNEVG